jgi:hypothetical protein
MNQEARGKVEAARDPKGRGCSGKSGARSEGIGIRSGTSGGPYGRCRSEIFESNKEAAQGPTPSCRAMHKANKADQRRW